MNFKTGKKISRAAILGNVKKEGVVEKTRELIDLLDKNGVEWFLEDVTAESLGLKGYEPENIPKNADILMVLGGDGTMLRAARVVGEKEIPIVGINLGHLGFLTELDATEVETAIPKILDGDYSIDTRTMLCVTLPGENGQRCALNEFVLDRGQSPRLIHHEVFVSEQFVALVLADGMIVATPTGSTAYNMAAGGAIMAPDMEAFQITSLSAYSLAVRPVIIDACETIKIIYSGDKQLPPRVSIDGQLGLQLPPSGEIIIKKAAFSAHFVHYHGRSFYRVLRDKLGWAITPPKDIKKLRPE